MAVSPGTLSPLEVTTGSVHSKWVSNNASLYPCTMEGCGIHLQPKTYFVEHPSLSYQR